MEMLSYNIGVFGSEMHSYSIFGGNLMITNQATVFNSFVQRIMLYKLTFSWKSSITLIAFEIIDTKMSI